MLKEYGYVRVGAIVPKLSLLNVFNNIEEMKKELDKAQELGIEIVTFPELSICGYTAQDMLLNDDLYNNIIKGLDELKIYSKNNDIIFIVGAPIKIDNALYNCAVVFNNGKILGITPKTFIPSYSEFYEARWFNSGLKLKYDHIKILDEDVTISNMLIYKCDNFPLAFSIDICEDLWMSNTPSNFTTLRGANLVFNLSASNETVGKVSYRRELVKTQAGKTISAYVYASSGIHESASDIIFSGHSMIAEPSGEMVENNRFDLESNIIYQDVDIFRINSDRVKTRTYEEFNIDLNYKFVNFKLSKKNNELIKKYDKKPFLSHNSEALDEILNIQTYALARRLLQLNKCKLIIGISGGSDSTLAFLISVRALKALNIDLKNLIAITMPGFGTSGRTYENSKNLIIESNATFKEISIKDACLKHFKDIDHKENVFDITYENTQARERTQILFDIANQEGGIVVGTGDLSELALGWATYNGDHMSNYGVNSSIPKTLVTTLIGHIRDNEENPIIKKTLTDILETPISPELLPIDENGNIQNTEKSVGPYILHDFFLYHFLRYGASIKKIYYLASRTFNEYTFDEIKACLKIFIKRFFTQQFKRNCVPDGIKVGSVSISPRGDLRMASDTDYNMYLKELEEL